MADKKITELNSANLPLTGSEEIPIVQDGETKKVNASDIGGEESLWERSTGANSLIPKDSGSVASGDNSIAEGFNTQAKAPYSRTGGRSTIVETNAEGGIAEGEDTITRGKGARSGGLESEANGDSSVADGDNVIAQSYAETVVGLYNELDASFNPTSSTPTDKAFSVGVGQFGDEKNGLVVRKNGIITADELTQAQYDAEPTGKVLVTKEILESKPKRVININLPFIRITSASSDDLFYWQKTFGVYADFTLSTGKTDKNTLVGNAGKALLRAPFDCKIINIQFASSPSTNSELVIGKVDNNVANYVNVYENTWSSTDFFDDNPTNLFNINKGEFIIPYFKIKSQGIAYSNFNITLEEI